MTWSSQLRIASFRDAKFGVMEADGRFGRRLAVHEYPFRDKPYVEDLGRSTRKISFRGFLVEDDATFGGGSVIAQRERMIAACEQAGSGTLVHPTLGQLKVSLVELAVSERWDAGRYFELGFSFIEAGERIFPSLLSATGDTVLASATAADGAASEDFVKRATVDLAQGAAVVSRAVSAAQTWSRMAQNLGNDATNIMGLVSTLSGNYGRFSGGRNFSGLTGAVSPGVNPLNTVQSLINQGTVTRNQLNLAANTLTGAAGGLGL